MKKHLSFRKLSCVSLLFLMLTAPLGLSAQTVLIDPAAEGGFELGTTFAANGWTEANSANNPWVLGTAVTGAPWAGNVAYVSNTSGTTNNYDVATPCENFFWRDVTFPGGEVNITLSFNWRNVGENNYDIMQVFLAPTTTNPSGTTTYPLNGFGVTSLTGATFLAAFQAQATPQTATISIPALVANNCVTSSTRRLIFAWKSDNSVGTNPPAAIDNISLTSAPLSPLPSAGPFTIDNTLPTAGTNFNSFTAAINWLNAAVSCSSNPFVFNVAAGQTFTENPPVITASGTSANTITFQKSGAGANPVILASGGTGTTDAAISITGGDYITFDGVDVAVTGGTALEYGYQIRNANANEAANFNTIKNCKITLSKANTSSIGIVVTSSTTGGGFTAGSAAGACSDNLIQSVVVENAYNGIFVTSGSSTFMGNNNTVTGTVANPTTVGAPFTGNPTGSIGGGSGATYGIQFNNQTNYTITRSVVQNITATTGIIRGIYIVGGRLNGTVSNNSIRGLRRESTSSTSAVNGLDMAFSTTSGFTNTINVFNNMVSNITAAYTGTASGTRALRGIILGSGNATSTYNVFHNSVSIDGSGSPNLSNICLEHGGTTAVNNVRNNIFANFTGAQTGAAKHYVVRSTSATAVGAAGSVSNNNNYYIANTTNGFVGLLNTTDAATIAAWTAGLTGNAGTDANSLNTNPNFLDNAIDLHLNTTIATQMESGGAQLNILDDIDGDIRQGQTGYSGAGTAPDLGADEGNFILLDLAAPSIAYTPLTFTCSTGDRTLTATISDATGVPTTGSLVPRVYYRKNMGSWFSSAGTFASGTATNSSWNFTIIAADMGGLAIGDTVKYYVIAQDAAGTPNIGSNASGAVATDVNTVTTHPSAPLNYTISNTLNGTYTVGVGGNYTTLTEAVNAYNNSCLSGPVVFSLTDATYPTETFPISINSNAFANAVNTLTIRPATGVSPVITGSSASAIIRLFGADFVTIDGSNNGTNTRDLTIENTNAAGTSVIWIGNSTSPLNAALSNTVRNTNITGNAPTTTVAGIIISSGATAGNAAEISNSNNSAENNSFRKAQNGIFAIGNATTLDAGWNFSNNSFGSNTPAEYMGFRGIAVLNAQGFTVSGNSISGVHTATTSTATGILLGSALSGGSVTKNQITNIRNTNSTGYGSNGIFLSASSSNTNLLVANNFVSDVAARGFNSWTQEDNGYGIMVNSGGGYQILHNTVNLSTNQTQAQNSAALNIASGVTNLNIRNNIFVNGQTTGTRYAVYSAVANTAFTTINFNDYVSTGSIGFLGSARATLADWQTATGQDASSVSIDPVFTSGTDLHLPAVSNISLIDLATPIAQVTDDIDGQLRGTTPDMGADEFANYPFTPNTPLQDSLVPSCATGTYVYAVGTPEPGVAWYWQTSATGTSTALPATDSLQVTLNGTFYLRAYNATLNLWSDNASFVTVSNIVTTPINIDPAGPVTICQGDPLTLSVTGLAAGPLEVLTQWNFNDDSTVPNIGSGSASLVGGTTATFASGAGSSDTATVVDRAWNTANYPAQGTNAQTAGVQFNVSTAGFKDIVFDFDIRQSGTAANTYVVQYNPDVTNGLSPWFNVDTFTYSVNNVFANDQTVDLTAFPAANNNPNLGVRVVSAFDGSTGQYAGVTSAYSVNGTVRYDMVTFSGKQFNYGFQWNNGATTQSISPTQTGMYSVVVTQPGACPGLDSVFVTVNPTFAVTLNPQICDNQTYTLPLGQIVNQTGIYQDTLTTVFGCDSIVIVNLTVNPTFNTTVNPIICSNETYILADGSSVTAAGTYILTVPTISGCDSTVTANLTVLPAQSFNVSAVICANEIYLLPDGDTVNTAGTYTTTFTAANGCDSTFVTQLTVKPVFTTVLNPVICANQSYTMPDGTTQNQAGTYTFPYTAVNGCDSTFTVNLTVNPIFTTTVQADICPGETYTLADGTFANATGVYTVTIPTVITGCDSTVIVNLTVRPTYNNVFNAAICQGETYTLANGVVVSQPGSYTAGVASIYGCDSIVTVNLTVNPVFTQTVSAVICQGEIYELPSGVNATTQGTYTSILQTVNGCDSTIITNLTVNPLPNVNLGANVAVLNPPVVLNGGAGNTSYSWNTGATTQTITVTQNGTYSVTVTNSFGCTASDTVTVNFTASIGSFGENGATVNIFPNPANQRFTLSVNGFNQGGNIQLDVLNALGMIVKTERLANVSAEFNHVVDVADLAAGTYLVRLKSNSAEATLRLLIAK